VGPDSEELEHDRAHHTSRRRLPEVGTDNGGPGSRDYWPGYYAAFVHDPDGNNIEAVWYDYSKVK
jgi:hypothetical protein